MSAKTKASLKACLTELTASIEALPEDVFSDAKGRQKVQTQIAGLKAAVDTPLESVNDMCFQPHQSAAAMVALKAGWLAVLADGHPKTAADIAAIKGGEPELIARIMMVLTATGVLDERGLRTYAINPVSRALLDPGWTNGLKHFFDHCAPVLLNLPDYFARNGYKVPQDVKTGPFADTWGGKNTWALYEAEPARGEVFHSFMEKWKGGLSIWFDKYPVETQLSDAYDKSDDVVLLVDVGGGRGQCLEEFVKQHGRRKNRLIVQDLPDALSPAEKLQPLGIEVMPYDFFTPQPVKGAKAYFFRGIFHDWPREACQSILRSTIAGMKPGYSKILIDDLVLPDVGVPPKGAFFDLSMMALETGTERTLQEWHDLLGSVGLRIKKVWSSEVALQSVIEAELDS
ncbi:MAG: hypothetical protein Q9181_000875 [Wetmoreana brouardii]